ncbi:hypothetical protein ZWY2020_054861 [Hordeum vulgare]|nr:hypothetical protein ZWY2020_054861 [Hordeum vulgare]
MLRWTYAYGYYADWDKLNLLQCLQGEAEGSLERLHGMAEAERTGSETTTAATAASRPTSTGSPSSPNRPTITLRAWQKPSKQISTSCSIAPASWFVTCRQELDSLLLGFN